MAFTTTPQLFRSSFLTPESYDRLLSQEKVSCSERVVYLQPTSALGKARKGASSSAGSGASRVESPKALRDNAAVYGGGAGQSSFPSLQHGIVILENDSTLTSCRQECYRMAESLTELQRSLLETQWALTANEHLLLDLYPLDRRSSVEEVGNAVRSGRPEVGSVVRSGRPSARQRRIQARKQPAVVNKKPAAMVFKGSTLEGSRTSKAKQGKPSKAQLPAQPVCTYSYMKDRIKRELLTPEREVVLSKKMKIGRNLKAARKKLTEILGCEPSDEQWAMSLKIPVRDVHVKLLEADRARDEMFMANLRLVVSIAKKYSTFGVTMADLIQEGALGLLRGLEKFNHKKGFKLSTYVHWWIRQGVTRAIAEHSRTVRLPVHLHERLGLINRAAATLRIEGGTASVKNISEALNMTDSMVSTALKATKKMISLDKAKRWGGINFDDDSLHNYVADPQIENNPWAAVDRILMKEDIDALLASTLCQRERDIVRLHYGLDHADGRRVSLENISHRIGISRERARQVESSALRKLIVSSQDLNLDVPCPY